MPINKVCPEQGQVPSRMCRSAAVSAVAELSHLQARNTCSLVFQKKSVEPLHRELCFILLLHCSVSVSRDQEVARDVQVEGQGRTWFVGFFPVTHCSSPTLCHLTGTV